MCYLQADHKGVLDRAREEYETRLQHAVERIALLTREVEKYKQLAGIEKFTQNALSGAVLPIGNACSYIALSHVLNICALNYHLLCN